MKQVFTWFQIVSPMCLTLVKFLCEEPRILLATIVWISGELVNPDSSWFHTAFIIPFCRWAVVSRRVATPTTACAPPHRTTSSAGSRRSQRSARANAADLPYPRTFRTGPRTLWTCTIPRLPVYRMYNSIATLTPSSPSFLSPLPVLLMLCMCVCAGYGRLLYTWCSIGGVVR